MSRLLVIPAAGLGSRLEAEVPKVLVRVAGETMLDRLLALYRAAVDRVAIVVHPAFVDEIRRRIARHSDASRIDCVIQRSPSGMLDAILLATPIAVDCQPGSVWVTWCDQVAVHPKTIARLADRTSVPGHEALVMPTVRSRHPYIHFQRDSSSRIVRVLHRREGDAMPESGEGDLGLFAMTATAYLDKLPEYAQVAETGHATGERNFLPFIPWLARTEQVTTFPCEHPMEAVGINTPTELAMVERYLRSRPPQP
jgi:bifunctional UDP-N-acetylglucosamine pyrophosphorylase/glucosamine-1-phosphate N-acetyltransferase